ncbi:B12-binding domain-containing radical SAM protein [Patescibacteria group bacterium]|nr:B12-binding domain-containing radical SAM protein [Patescibacteria group bacterium]
MKKVALLIPNYKSGFKLESVPLNLAYLGAVLEKEGHKVKGFNLYFENLTGEEILKWDIFGISSPTSVFPETVKLAKKIKKINPGCVVVVGGPHPTACPEECLGVKEIDYVISGEGESAFPLLIKAFEKKVSLAEVPSLAYRKKGKIRKNPKGIITDLDEIPFPAKHIFDTSLYPSKQKAYGDIIASRGCPFKCTNCKPGLDSIAPYRLRKPERVVDEMEWLFNQYGVRHFTFSDSELVGPKPWVKKFTSEIIKRKLKITYSCNGRVDQIDREVLNLLKKSGCIFIGYGIESGSQEVIDKLLKKGIDLKKTEEIISETVKSGIGAGGWFMVGIPGETEEQVRKTIEFARKLDLLIIEISIATPWPETGFFTTCKENDWLLTEDWGKMNEKNFVAIETPFLKAEEVKALFASFGRELVKNGWRADITGSRYYHPQFLKRTIVISLFSVMRRGLQRGDFVRFFNWLRKRY